jgi:hypothetical protein
MNLHHFLGAVLAIAILVIVAPVVFLAGAVALMPLLLAGPLVLLVVLLMVQDRPRQRRTRC